VEKQLLCVLIITYVSPSERNSSKLLCDTHFDSFEFFLRHWPPCPPFNEMIEHDLSPPSFAPEADHRAIASSGLSIAVMHSPFAHRSKSSPEYLADLQSVHVRKRLRSRPPRGSVGLARWSKYPADLISAEQPLQYDIG
jgi:hypothetical protein